MFSNQFQVVVVFVVVYSFCLQFLRSNLRQSNERFFFKKKWFPRTRSKERHREREREGKREREGGRERERERERERD